MLRLASIGGRALLRMEHCRYGTRDFAPTEQRFRGASFFSAGGGGIKDVAVNLETGMPAQLARSIPGVTIKFEGSGQSFISVFY